MMRPGRVSLDRCRQLLFFCFLFGIYIYKYVHVQVQLVTMGNGGERYALFFFLLNVYMYGCS
jgi:hypothetical protein